MIIELSYFSFVNFNRLRNFPADDNWLEPFYLLSIPLFIYSYVYMDLINEIVVLEK